ncbi:MAG TPA: VCBS repeat-containing protein [Terriglobia bacterium]|nr:VCBS repeat-containing protein [Terriglobia bacterium]
MMGRKNNSARRRFLKSAGAVIPAALLGLKATEGYSSPSLSGSTPAARSKYVDLGYTMAGDDAISFRKHTIDLGDSESVTVVDMNGDGRLDIVCGENWYEQGPPEPGRGPRFIKHKFRDLPYTDYYLEDLTDLAIDVNGDGNPDVVSCSYWAKPLTWWENPGKGGGPWREHVMETGSPVEFAFLVDLLNTGKPRELLPQFGNPKFPLTWYELAGKGATNSWIAHEISPKSYGHGIGAGDVNGDGRTDIITPKGWFEAPPDPRTGQWTFHPEFDLGATGFIYTMDVNGDGVPDLVTTLGHGYGIFWVEQKKDAAGNRTWVKHMIDDGWSQAHAMTLADLNGDGRLELVTGKRYYAHEHDPGANEPLGVYWYEALNREGTNWRRHILDYATRTGAGLQIPVVDIDGDGDLDILVAGKSGLYLFENLIGGR